MDLIRITQPRRDAEPVTVAEMRDHLRIDGNHDDEAIYAAITAARMQAEHYSNRPIAYCSYALLLDDFPPNDDCAIRLPADVRSIVSITYRDADDAEQTLASSAYRADYERQKITVLDAWPLSASDVRVAFWAGYKPGAVGYEPLPSAVIAAVKLMAADLYEQRENTAIGISYTPTNAAQNLLNTWRTPVGCWG